MAKVLVCHTTGSIITHPGIPMQPVGKALAGATLARFRTAATANPKDDLHAFTQFMKTRSLRATATDPANGEQISTMEHVAPDRMGHASTTCSRHSNFNDPSIHVDTPN